MSTKTYTVMSAEGYEFGNYEANSAQEARDLCAQDAGYKSEADMLERLSPLNALVAVETEA